MNENHQSAVVANPDEIACMAFRFWEKAGCPKGHDLDFWLAAETLILAAPRPDTQNGVSRKPFSGMRTLF